MVAFGDPLHEKEGKNTHIANSSPKPGDCLQTLLERSLDRDKQHVPAIHGTSSKSNLVIDMEVKRTNHFKDLLRDTRHSPTWLSPLRKNVHISICDRVPSKPTGKKWKLCSTLTWAYFACEEGLQDNSMSLCVRGCVSLCVCAGVCVCVPA